MNRARFVHATLLIFLGFYSQGMAALVWSEGAGFRSAQVEPGPGGKAGFTLMNPQQTGVWFTNILQGDAYLTNNDIEFARSANRFRMEPARGIYFVGFRLALGRTIQGNSSPKNFAP